MADKKGVQQKLGRVRAPKVHITFDAHTDGAMKKKELPFVVGVMADLSNKPILDQEGDKVPVSKRKFKEVDRDNFGEYMAAISPEASVRVPNALDNTGGTISAKLNFKSMKDFRPDEVAKQFPVLNEILELRKMLSDWKGKIDGNTKLEKELQAIIEKTKLIANKSS